MKRASATLLLLTAVWMSPASPADAASVADVRAAYQATLKCFVANGNALGERRAAGDQAGVARYDAGGKRSYDGAFKLGAALGLTDRQINRDLDATESSELPRMVKDRNYFIDTVATCKGLGLMD